MDTYPTITVSSTEGWHDTTLYITVGEQFHITYVSGEWTVDKRNFGYVKLGGYTPAIDKTIFQGCKINSSWTYGALLGRIGSGGTAFLLDHEGTYTALQPFQSGNLYLRIHDDDRCLGDNDGSLRIQVSDVPAMEPSNLIVLVHGCCTDTNGLNDWFDIRNLMQYLRQFGFLAFFAKNAVLKI